MEGGVRGNLLDPAAAEFHPSPPAVSPAAPFPAVGYPQIYYPYVPPPPPQPPATQFFNSTPAVPAYHNHYQPQVLPPVNALPPTTTMAVLEGTEATTALAAATRSVALSLVPRRVREGEVRTDMELFGGVRGLEMGSLQTDGVVTVHFFDLRSAQTAVAEICAQHSRRQAGIGYVVGVPGAGNWSLPTPQWEWRAPQGVAGGGVRGLVAGHAVWAQFAFDDQQHRSSIVVMNSDPSVSLLALRQLFEAFGAVRDAREMAAKPLHKFVEFFDTRDAARAYSELNCRKFHGRRLVLEFTRPFSGSQASSYAKRSSTSAPRLLRGCSKPAQHSRWNHGASSSFSLTSATASTGSNQQELVGAPVVLLQRSQTNAATSSSSSSISIPGVGGHSSTSSGKRNKNSSSHQPSSSASPSSKHHGQPQQQQQQTSGSSSSSSSNTKKGWKNQAKSNGGDKRFLFQEVELDDSAASASRDPRTTVMIRNIPNKYSQKLLLNMLDNHCIHCNEQIGDGEDDEPYSAYDFVYLPIDFNNKCNVGYGFVNLTSPEAAFRLYKAFHHQPWEVFNSRKICQVTYARLQGLEALMEHFRNSKFACDNDEYMPVFFSPPRDGKLLTEPVPVVPREGNDSAISLTKQVVDGLSRTQESTEAAAAFLQAEIGGASSTTASTHAPSENADDDEDDIGRRSSGDDHDDESAAVEEYAGSGISEVFLRLSCGD